MNKYLLLSLFSLFFGLSANAYDAVIDDIYYNLDEDNKTAEVTYGSTKYTGSFSIPATIIHNGNTYIVREIGKYAFYNCTDLTSVTLPNSRYQYSIGDFAFQGCSNLTSITIPSL